jgi:DNA-binding NarL/FixJ family response regulator
MDIEMPITDGITATREIIDALPSTAIVIVTQYDDKWMRMAAMKAGARGYVLKENLLALRPLLKELA